MLKRDNRGVIIIATVPELNEINVEVEQRSASILYYVRHIRCSRKADGYGSQSKYL
jgi:hypothetical protein